MKELFVLPRMVAGFVAALIGYASAGILIYQAAMAAGGTPEQISSWLWAIGIGMGVLTISLSLRFRQPVLCAWSTPGAPLLITSLPGLSMGEAIGIFIHRLSQQLLRLLVATVGDVDISFGNRIDIRGIRRQRVGITAGKITQH